MYNWIASDTLQYLEPFKCVKMSLGYFKTLFTKCVYKSYIFNINDEDLAWLITHKTKQNKTNHQTRESVFSLTARQNIDPWGGFTTWDTVWVLSKPRNHRNNLLLKNNAIEMNRTECFPYIFIDFTKAFGIVNGLALWNTQRKQGCLDHFTKFVSTLDTRMKASVS